MDASQKDRSNREFELIYLFIYLLSVYDLPPPRCGHHTCTCVLLLFCLVWFCPMMEKASAEEAATLPPAMPRLSPRSNSNGSLSSTPRRTPGGGGGGGLAPSDGGSDFYAEEDDTEMQLQNTITHIERLILSSRKVKNEAPGAVVSAAAVAARRAGGNGDGKADTEGSVAEAVDGEAGAGAGAVAGSRGAGARQPPTAIDRAAMMTRRQSTSFFDTKPVFSARDSSGSFTKAWNGTGTVGTSGGGGANSSSKGGLGPLGEDGDGVRWPKTAKAAYSRRQSEKWGWTGDVGAEEVVVGTPPTVEGSAGSSSGSPPDRCVGWNARDVFLI